MVAVAVVGFALRALGDGGEVLDVIGIGLVGVAGVIAVSAVFYEIGAGEDAERARAAAELEAARAERRLPRGRRRGE